MLTEDFQEGNTYTINLMKHEDLEKFIGKVKLERQACIKEHGATRDEINVRRSKRVELTNIISGGGNYIFFQILHCKPFKLTNILLEINSTPLFFPIL